jgi:hypothetical protein
LCLATAYGFYFVVNGQQFWLFTFLFPSAPYPFSTLPSLSSISGGALRPLTSSIPSFFYSLKFMKHRKLYYNDYYDEQGGQGLRLFIRRGAC